MPPDILEALKQVLDTKDDKNYDPRMEELSRSDKLIDPTNEALSKLEDPEIFHIAKIRGAQISYAVPLWKIRKAYLIPDMLDYHTPYIDYIRNLDPANKDDKAELDQIIGGLPMTNKMMEELVKLRHSQDAWTAKLYADSIKPIASNQPIMFPQQQEQQEGALSKIFGFIFGRRQENQNTGGYRR